MPPHKEKEPSDPWVECSSPPCFAHELSAVSDGFAVTDPQQARDVSTWRKSTRIDLLARRAAYSTAERHLFEQRLGTHLLNVLDELRLTGANKILSGYWPIKSELNLLSVFEALSEKGVRLALPVVEEKAQPLVFYEWKPGAKMTRGVSNIPVPAKKNAMKPDVLLAPLVGWDRQGYRLGYGGGYFDRTLAALKSPRFVIGVGLQATELKTIFPQPHDIPLDMIITEEGIQWRRK